MNLYPAIDIRGGNVVRLHKGDFAAETIYDDDPLAVAQAFEAAGAPWVHIVDLDAAKTGDPVNRPIITKIASTLSISVQTGGGIRDHASIETLLAGGVKRVVLGTIAVKEPELTESFIQAFPHHVAVGLDARNGKVAVQGWVDESQLQVVDLIERYEPFAVAAFIVTDIERDGTLEGPDVDGLTAVIEATEAPVIASGGVGSIVDIQALKLAGVEGVITGKALYEGRFTLAEALEACE